MEKCVTSAKYGSARAGVPPADRTCISLLKLLRAIRMPAAGMRTHRPHRRLRAPNGSDGTNVRDSSEAARDLCSLCVLQCQLVRRRSRLQSQRFQKFRTGRTSTGADLFNVFLHCYQLLREQRGDFRKLLCRRDHLLVDADIRAHPAASRFEGAQLRCTGEQSLGQGFEIGLRDSGRHVDSRPQVEVHRFAPESRDIDPRCPLE